MSDPRGFYEKIARNSPKQLIAMVNSGELSWGRLTFAAEAVGYIENTELVISTLVPLLAHSSPLIREGALYGIDHHFQEKTSRNPDLGVVNHILKMADSDPSPGVRAAAQDVVFMFEIVYASERKNY